MTDHLHGARFIVPLPLAMALRHHRHWRNSVPITLIWSDYGSKVIARQTAGLGLHHADTVLGIELLRRWISYQHSSP
jgi:hypothetical protein